MLRCWGGTGDVVGSLKEHNEASCILLLKRALKGPELVPSVTGIIPSSGME